MSGRPASIRWCSRNLSPARCRAERTDLSGAVFSPVMRDIFQLRRSFEILSISTRESAILEDLAHYFCDLYGEQWRYSIAYLAVLRSPRSAKEIIVREGLNPRRFPHSQTPALCRIVVNVVVAILANMTRYRCCRPIAKLDAKPISEKASVKRFLYIFMAG